MGLNTPFIPENIGGGLLDFGFFKVQRQAKSVLVELMTNFFSSMVNTYKITMPDLIQLQNHVDASKLFINRDFPYAERKLPMVITSIKGMKEKKMYMGADNLIGYRPHTSSTGTTTVEVYGGAYDIDFSLIVVAQSPDERSRILELLGVCFTHFYRWQYYYTYGDGNQFSVVPNVNTLSFGAESEVADVDKINQLYISSVSITAFVEYNFTSLDIMGAVSNADTIIDTGSGPIES